MKRCLLFVPLFALALPSSGETIKEALKRCEQQQNSLKRLVCYDQVSKNANGYQDVELPDIPQGSAAPVARREAQFGQRRQPQPQQQAPQTIATEDNFGKELETLNRERIKQISSAVVKVVTDPYGKVTLTLENGQVWKQLDNAKMRMKEGEVVTLKRGALNSFGLSKAGTNRTMKVKRVK